MKNNLLIILIGLIISTQSIYGQTSKGLKIKIKAAATDTINFIYLQAFKGHVFSKITEGKSNYFYKKGDGGYTRFFSKVDTLGWLFSSKNYNLKSNDTVADVWWYLQKLDVSICTQSNFNHAFGKLLINTTGKTIRIQDVRNYATPRTNFGTLIFKVIKISPYEIILEDLQNREKHRRYYFVKNYN